MLHQCASMEAMEYFVAKKEEADAEKELKKEVQEGLRASGRKDRN
jgi:hypothetical protein